jgi:ABC-type multidrug transport system fused ATPase/permease subunit
VFLLFFSIIVSLIETIALSAVMIFVSMATNFDAISKSKVGSYLYVLSGCSSSINFIMLLGFFLIVFYFVRCLISICHVYLMIRFSQGRYQAWAKQIFKNFLFFPFSQFTTKTSSKVGQILFNSTGQSCQVINGILTISAEFFTVSCVYIMLMFVNWKMTCVLTLLLATKSFFLIKMFSKSLAYAGVLSRKYSIETAKIFADSYGNYKMLKLLETNAPLINRFINATKGVASSNILNVTLQGAPRFILETMGFFILIGVIIYVIYVYHSATNVLSMVSLYTLAFYRLLPSMNKILASYNQIIFSKHAVYDIYEFLCMPRETLGCIKISFCKEIVLKDIYFGYASNKPILEHIDLVIKRGERIAFVGESGAGKSTIVDILMGFYKPQKGLMLIDGVTLSDDNRSSWRAKIGYVPQNIYLFDGTVAENVVFGRDYDEDKLINSLKCVHIYDDLLKKDGINTRVGDLAVMISGGQKQRLALARALYGDPEVLVFDEATSALDYATEEKIVNEIYNIDTGKTLIIVAHRLTTVERCDTIYKIEKGHVILIDDIEILYKQQKHKTTVTM